MGVSLKHVARLAGVSPATVSRVVRGERYVSSSTRQKVLDAIEELNYRPNSLARSMKQQRANAIGIIVPDISNSFFSTLTRGVQHYARKLGFDTLIYDTAGDPARELVGLSLLLSRRIDGAILGTERVDFTGIPETLAKDASIVLVHNMAKGIEADFVATDNALGARMAVEYLLSLGHRRIGLITGPRCQSCAIERQHGYIEALLNASLEVDSRLVRHGDFDLLSGYQLANVLLDLDRPPTALFVADCRMTVGALRALRERETRVPEQVAIASFDDVENSFLSYAPVTAVIQPTIEIGQKAAELVIRRVCAQNKPQRQTLRLRPGLIIRGPIVGPPPDEGV